MAVAIAVADAITVIVAIAVAVVITVKVAIAMAVAIGLLPKTTVDRGSVGCSDNVSSGWCSGSDADDLTLTF